MRIITKGQSKNIDKISIENYNVSQNSLMNAAANGIVSHIKKYSSSINKKPRILILCGKGNNGGDSICAASILIKEGYHLRVHFLIEKNEIRGPSKIYYEEFVNLHGQSSFGLEFEIFNDFDLLIDGIIGIGFRGTLDDNLVDWGAEAIGYVDEFDIDGSDLYTAGQQFSEDVSDTFGFIKNVLLDKSIICAVICINSRSILYCILFKVLIFGLFDLNPFVS